MRGVHGRTQEMRGAAVHAHVYVRGVQPAAAGAGCAELPGVSRAHGAHRAGVHLISRGHGCTCDNSDGITARVASMYTLVPLSGARRDSSHRPPVTGLSQYSGTAGVPYGIYRSVILSAACSVCYCVTHALPFTSSNQLAQRHCVASHNSTCTASPSQRYDVYGPPSHTTVLVLW